MSLSFALDGAAPVRADGSHYPWSVTYQGASVVADTAAEAMSALIHCYPALEEQQALVARYRFAEAAAAALQRVYAGAVGSLDAECAQPKTSPVFARHWGAPCPLVLLATHYLPYTDTVVPAGNVVLIDPSSTVSLLRSMASAGVIDLREPDVALDPAAGAAG